MVQSKSGQPQKDKYKVQNGIGEQTARDYMCLYRTLNQLPARYGPRKSYAKAKADPSVLLSADDFDLIRGALVIEAVITQVDKAGAEKLPAITGLPHMFIKRDLDFPVQSRSDSDT